MNKTVKKIAVILVVVILLPAIFFSAYEINSLSESEQVIEEIYNNQIDAILFSLNQYSEDIISGWRNKINNSLSAGNEDLFNAFLNLYGSINFVFIADSIGDKDISIHTLKTAGNEERNIINEILSARQNQIRRLFTYQRGGYLKLEPVELESENSSVVFILDNGLICGVIFNPKIFTRDILSPKIKLTAENKFIIRITKTGTNEEILSTASVQGNDIQQKKKLWLIPKYELGILLQGGTIESIVKQRAVTNLILILVLTLILIAGVYIVFKNIRKEVELAQIKSDFVSNVSHELRTPLALISMFAETLEMGRARTEEKKKEYYTIISKEAGRLSGIVNKILSFSKIEAGKRQYHFANINPNNVAEDVFNTYQFHLQNNGFKLIFEKAENLPDIKADGEAISEALINLIDNGVKYSSDRKEIKISTGLEKNRIYLEVADKGIGISEENQKKIFDKFYRVGEGLVHNTKGTGLGLTIVSHIVEAHHGEIKIKSKPGEGSSFKLLFPADLK